MPPNLSPAEQCAYDTVHLLAQGFTIPQASTILKGMSRDHLEISLNPADLNKNLYRIPLPASAPTTSDYASRQILLVAELARRPGNFPATRVIPATTQDYRAIERLDEVERAVLGRLVTGQRYGDILRALEQRYQIVSYRALRYIVKKAQQKVGASTTPQLAYLYMRYTQRRSS